MRISQKLRNYFRVPSPDLERMLLDLEDFENHYQRLTEQAWKVAAKFERDTDIDVEELKEIMDV